MKILLVLLLLGGCATKVPAELDKLQRDVQDCILAGGHPHLGPGQTVECEP